MIEPESSNSPEMASAPEMSLGGRLANIFVAPGEVFDEIRVSPPTMSNWLAPMVMVIIMSIIYSMVVFSQPAILQGMRAPMEKKFQQMVVDKKLTQQQADQQLDMVEKFMTPTVFRLFGILGSLFFPPVMLFGAALVVWLVGKYAIGGHFGYMKTVEGVGLAYLIMVPGSLIAMLLAVIYGNLGMTAGPILLLGHFDAGLRLDRVLSALDVPSLWWVAVLSVLLSRFSGASFVKSALWGFGVWLVVRIGPAILFGGNQ